MPIVKIPSLMRDLTEGRDTVEVPGRTVGQVIEALEAAYPGVRARLCSGNHLRAALAVSVDGKVSQMRLLQPVTPQSVIYFLPAVEGG